MTPPVPRERPRDRPECQGGWTDLFEKPAGTAGASGAKLPARRFSTVPVLVPRQPSCPAALRTTPMRSAARGDRMPYNHSLSGTRHVFADLKTLLARASPARSGDALAGIAAASASERVAAQMALAYLPLRTLLDEPVIPCPDELPPAAAADKLLWLIGRMRELRLSGVALKDEQPAAGQPPPDQDRSISVVST